MGADNDDNKIINIIRTSYDNRIPAVVSFIFIMLLLVFNILFSFLSDVVRATTSVTSDRFLLLFSFARGDVSGVHARATPVGTGHNKARWNRPAIDGADAARGNSPVRRVCTCVCTCREPRGA